MVQQGQVFKLKARGADGRPLWAYRHRLDGRGSARPQVGGFASSAEAEEALRKALARLRRGGCAATMTLADLVDERSVAEGDLRLAAVDPGRAPLQGVPGAPAGPEPGGGVGVAH